MAAYNGEKFIKEQIDSILNQLGTNDELIISDDGSTDDTLNIIGNCRDPRIKLFHNKLKHGVIHNFENALKQASGDYIFLADQDDVWLSGRVQKVREHLDLGNHLVLVNAKIIDKENNTLQDSFFEVNRTSHGFWRNLWKNGFLGCCMAFRKEVYPFILPFPRVIPMHDWWIGLSVLSYRKSYVFVEEPLHAYRKHGNNKTDSGNKSNAPYWLRLKNRVILLLFVIIRHFQNIIYPNQRAKKHQAALEGRGILNLNKKRTLPSHKDL